MSPEACKKQAIPSRQALGLKRICSSVNKSDHRIEEFKGYLHKKGLKKPLNVKRLRVRIERNCSFKIRKSL